MTDNPLLQNLTPHLTQRGRFRPEPGARIAIMLPGEQVSAIVIKVVSQDTLIVQLGSVFFQKHHQYRKDDIVPVRRGFDKMLGVELWEIVGQARRDLASAEALLDGVGRSVKAWDQFTRAEATLDGSIEAPQSLPSVGSPAAPPSSVEPQLGSPDLGETTIAVGSDGTLKRVSAVRKVPRRPPAAKKAAAVSTGDVGKSPGAATAADRDFWQ